jgi:hypothetical protein
MKEWLFRKLILPRLRGWLATRALVLPHAKREQLARQLRIPEPVLHEVESELRKHLLNVVFGDDSE